MTNPKINMPSRDKIVFDDTIIDDGLELLLGQFKGTDIELLLSPFLYQILELEYHLCSLFLNRTLQAAFGDGLDQYGLLTLEPRGDLTDNSYKKMIRTKILSIFSGGEINRILQSFAVIGDTNYAKYTPNYPADFTLEYETDDFLTVDAKRRLKERVTDLTPVGVGYLLVETVPEAFAFDGPSVGFGFGVGKLSGHI